MKFIVLNTAFTNKYPQKIKCTMQWQVGLNLGLHINAQQPQTSVSKNLYKGNKKISLYC